MCDMCLRITAAEAATELLRAMVAALCGPTTRVAGAEVEYGMVWQEGHFPATVLLFSRIDTLGQVRVDLSLAGPAGQITVADVAYGDGPGRWRFRRGERSNANGGA